MRTARKGGGRNESGGTDEDIGGIKNESRTVLSGETRQESGTRMGELDERERRFKIT